jgi:hypothetical protein
VQAQPDVTDHAPRWPLAVGEHDHGLDHGLDHEHGTRAAGRVHNVEELSDSESEVACIRPAI